MAEFTKREMEILLLLLRERDWITGEEISGRLDISRKTVRQELRQIEKVLGMEGKLCAGQKKGYRLDRLSEEQLQKILVNLEENEEHYNMKDRTSVLALYLLFCRDYVTMDQLGEVFFLSKSTVFSEIKTLKRWMARQGGISLEVSGVRGVRILGGELDRRIRCATFCMPGILRQIPLEEEELSRYERELAAIRQELGLGLSRLDCLICGEDLGKAARYLAVSLLRDRLGFSLEEEERKKTGMWGQASGAVKEILPRLERVLGCRFSRAEADGLEEFLASAKTPGGEGPEGEEYGEDVPARFCRLEQAVRHILELPPGSPLFLSREEAFRHFLRMERRLSWDRNATNYYDKELAAAFPMETYVMDMACRQVMEKPLPRAELMFLTAYLDPDATEEREEVSVLLVSDQNAGIAGQIEKFVRKKLGMEVSRFVTEPAYVFEAEGGGAEAGCLPVTTEGETALRHPEFLPFPVVIRSRDEERLERILREWKNSLEERKIRQVLSAYGKPDRNLEGGGRLPDLLEAMGWDGEETSVSPLREELLYLCRFRKEEEPSVRLLCLDRPVEVEQKEFRRVLAVSWNGKREGRAVFFRAVRRLLSEGSGPVQKKSL